MTNLITPESPQQALEGRSVRDVVAHNPEQVDDAWCRKILRKILQSLELQYGMQMPHRAITLDTVVFHANGEPFLLSDDIDADPAPDAQQADDLAALAGVIHYAITQERTPAEPLDGRGDGYSAGLVATIDACTDPDPARRPRTFVAMRGLLETVAPAPLATASNVPATVSSLLDVPASQATVSASGQVFVSPPVEPGIPYGDAGVPQTGVRRGRRWAIAACGGAIAIALALALFPTLRDGGSHDRIALPRASEGASPDRPAPAGAASAFNNTVAADAQTSVAGGGRTDSPANNVNGSPASGGSSSGTTVSGGATEASDASIRIASASAATPAPRTVPARAAAAVRVKARTAAGAPVAVAPSAGHASYQLQIKPWGSVSVDGVDRGVSPPLKRLALTPGRHTVRISNPKYRDSVLEFESAQTTSNGKIIVDFTHDAP